MSNPAAKHTNGFTDEYFASIGKTPEEAQEIQNHIAMLEARLQESQFQADVFATLRTWWESWEENVPWIIKWLVYGILVGLLVWAIIQGIGFTAGGVAAKSLAAGIQAGIGDVEAGSVFAAMQSLGTASVFIFAAIGGVIGLIIDALHNMAAE